MKTTVPKNLRLSTLALVISSFFCFSVNIFAQGEPVVGGGINEETAKFFCGLEDDGSPHHTVDGQRCTDTVLNKGEVCFEGNPIKVVESMRAKDTFYMKLNRKVLLSLWGVKPSEKYPRGRIKISYVDFELDPAFKPEDGEVVVLGKVEPITTIYADYCKK